MSPDHDSPPAGAPRDTPPSSAAPQDASDRDCVLLIEDEEAFRELLQAFLETEGFVVHAVPDGRRAEVWLRANPADIVVTDLCMPNVDGMELLIRMRKMGIQIPVIAMSGGVAGDMVGMLRAAALLGAHRVLEKPFSLRQLAIAVRETIASHRSPGESVVKP